MHKFVPEEHAHPRVLRCLTVLVFWITTGCGGSFFISQSTVTSISLSPSNPTMHTGDTEQFVATGTTAGGDTLDVTSGATWKSSKPSVATVDSTGLATAVGDGSATITASYQRGSTQTILYVTSATLSSIAVTPANTSITIGNAQQYTATGTYSDGTTKDLTGSVTWSSSHTSVATISTGGLATGIAAGSSVISATKGAYSASTVLTVD